MRNVVIGGVGVTPFGKFLERSLKSLSEEAAGHALREAGVTADDVERVFFANSAAGVVTGQEMIRGQSSLRNTVPSTCSPEASVTTADFGLSPG